MSSELEHPHGVCLCVAYDGTEFHGWQAQPGLRTVQGVVEEALGEMEVGFTTLRVCSRTDAGVHALGQLVAFSTQAEIPPRGWVHGLNRLLPRDVVVRDAQPCFRRYHPRFHARSKRYRYLIQCAMQRDPLLRNRAWYLSPKYARKDVRTERDLVEQFMDLDAMRQAARAMVGTHDFVAFRAASDERETSERTMFSLRLFPGWQGRRDLLAVEVEGSAFMKNMVRIMVGTLIDVGRGELSPEAIKTMLTPNAARPDAGQTAPAQGLSLVDIHLARYDGPADAFGRPTKATPPGGVKLVIRRAP